MQICNFSVLCAEINETATVPAVRSRPRDVSGTENLEAVHVQDRKKHLQANVNAAAIAVRLLALCRDSEGVKAGLSGIERAK